MLFVAFSNTVVMPANGFSPRILGATKAVSPSPAWLLARRGAYQESGRLMNNSVQPRRHCAIFLENIASPQFQSGRGLVLLRGGATDSDAVMVGIAIGICLLLAILAFAVNKTGEVLWFFVVPRIWAGIRRGPFKPTAHKMSWKWWRADVDKNGYTYCLVTATAYAYFTKQYITYWKDQTPVRLRAIMEGWELILAGSGTWTQVGWAGLILLEQVLCFAGFCVSIRNVWLHSGRAWKDIANGPDIWKKASIGAAIVIPMSMLFFIL